MPLPAAIPLIMAAAPLIGKIFGHAGQGAADQRVGENNQRLQQAHLANADALARAALLNNNATTRASLQNTDRYNRAGLDLQRQQFSQQEPNAQARQAMLGSLLQRIQPLALSGLSDRVQQSMLKMSSIVDALGPDAREAGGRLAQRGLSGLRAGPTAFADLPPVSLPDVLHLPPAMQAALHKSGLLEKILGAGGVIGSTVGALGDLGSVWKKPTGFEEAGGG